MKRINITQAATVVGVAGLLGFASLAIAADQKPAAKPAAPAFTDPASLPKFAHVIVVNSTPAQRAASNAQAKPAAALGQRAYIDADSKRLRQVTPEDLAANAAEAQASAPAATGSPVEVAAVAGRAFALDESSHAYSVAHIDSKGKVKIDCVEDQAKAEAALKSAATVQEDSHEK